MAAYESQGKKEMKKKSLEERRIRLGSLLNQEMRQYEVRITIPRLPANLYLFFTARVEGYLTKQSPHYEREVFFLNEVDV